METSITGTPKLFPSPSSYAKTFQSEPEDHTPSGSENTTGEPDLASLPPRAESGTNGKRKIRSSPPTSDSEEESGKKANIDASTSEHASQIALDDGETNDETLSETPSATMAPPGFPIAPQGEKYKKFMIALKESGFQRSALMKVVDGPKYYHLRGVFLQHTLGDFTNDKVRVHRVNEKEKTTWKRHTGRIPMDAFADLLRDFHAFEAKLFQ